MSTGASFFVFFNFLSFAVEEWPESSLEGRREYDIFLATLDLDPAIFKADELGLGFFDLLILVDNLAPSLPLSIERELS